MYFFVIVQHCLLGVFLTKLCNFCAKVDKKVPWSNQDQINDFHQNLIKRWSRIIDLLTKLSKMLTKVCHDFHTNSCFAGSRVKSYFSKNLTTVWWIFDEKFGQIMITIFRLLNKKFIIWRIFGDFRWVQLLPAEGVFWSIFSLNAVTTCRFVVALCFFLLFGRYYLQNCTFWLKLRTLKVADRGWQRWLATVVGNRGWQPWSATVVGHHATVVGNRGR